LIPFSILWIGQSVSLLGTTMTGFALAIWAFQIAPLEMRATAFSYMQVAYLLPLILVSPLAGVLVDRWDRKRIMILSDLLAGLATAVILVLYVSGNLRLWHLFVVNAIEGILQTFQWPAYSAAITLMVEKKHYARASAMTQLAGNTSGIFAPLLAGSVIGFIPSYGVLFILVFDVLTFLFAVGTILFLRIPPPVVTAEGRLGRGSLMKEIVYGFQYIWKRPGLLGLQVTYLFGNFFSNLSFTLLAPMVLTRTAGNSLIFGSVQTAGSLGGVLGGLAISAWGGLKRKSVGVTAGWALVGLTGVLVIGLGRSPWIWAAGMFMAALLVPLIDSSNQAIWQSKVAPDVQGRVFSTRRMIAWLANPLGAALAGPLADRLLEPNMQPGAELAVALGWLVGSGPGAGMALVFVYAGLAILLVGMIAYSVPAIRQVEDLLLDHDQALG
jgi:MFS transporter, DHA3 family, macrolide efflux protein